MNTGKDKILITGATCNVGRHVVANCCARALVSVR